MAIPVVDMYTGPPKTRMYRGYEYHFYKGYPDEKTARKIATNLRANAPNKESKLHIIKMRLVGNVAATEMWFIYTRGY